MKKMTIKSNNPYGKIKAMVIRRKHRTDRRLLKKEIRTLHKRLKKADTVATTFSLEQEPDHKGMYHSHLIVRYNDKKNLVQYLNRFIGGETWRKKQELLYDLQINQGIWGEVRMHDLYDDRAVQNYIEKHHCSETFV